MKLEYPDRIYKEIAQLAAANPTEEIGGVITASANNGFTIRQLTNCCIDPENGYIPSSLKYVAAQEHSIVCHWHTHINNRLKFSGRDLNAMHLTGGDFLLYNLPHNHWEFKNPDRPIPYLGREWEQSWTDCYTLIRDFYRQELLLELPPPFHNDNDRPWEDPNWNEPLEKLSSHFDRLNQSTKALPYDLVLFNGLQGQNPSHLGLLLQTKCGYQLLHHPYKRLSLLDPTIDPKKIHSIWRSKWQHSTSNYSDNWAIDMGEPTKSKPINLVRESVTYGSKDWASSSMF
jgi:Prokaryotic homologs of the JAB domain/NlpC/P60 family